MRQLFYFLIILLMLGGCGQFSNIKTGSNTITKYRPDGSVESQEQRDLPLGDSQYDYQETKRTVAREMASVQKERMKTYAKIVQNSMAHASTKTEAVLIGVVASLSLSQVNPSIAKDLEAVGTRPMNGYEFMSDGLGKITDVAWTVPVSIGIRQQGKSQREALKNAGDVQTVSGDGNTVSTRKTRTDSIVHANTTGQNSPTNVDNNQQAAGCPSGDCGQDESDGGGTNACLSDPLITTEFLAAIPGNCSSRASYCAGRCSQKP